jgi:hypothetical protein
MNMKINPDTGRLRLVEDEPVVSAILPLYLVWTDLITKS